MATIKNLTQIPAPTDDESVVIQNSIGNFKADFHPIDIVNYATGIAAGSTVKEAIATLIDYYLSVRGGSKAWGIGLVCAQWASVSNGIQIMLMLGRWGDYKAIYGIAITQANGVHAFTRFDTGSAAGTLRVGEISSNPLS